MDRKLNDGLMIIYSKIVGVPDKLAMTVYRSTYSRCDREHILHKYNFCYIVRTTQ